MELRPEARKFQFQTKIEKNGSEVKPFLGCSAGRLPRKEKASDYFY
jgi:hypothetical protein